MRRGGVAPVGPVASAAPARPARMASLPAWLAWLAVLAWVPGVAAQAHEASAGTRAHGVAAEHPATAGAAAASVPLPVDGLRPADVVARLAREALAAPSKPGAWKDLAGALPEMALTDDADLETTFDAAHVADSLAVQATAPVAASMNVRAAGASLMARVRPVVAALSAVPRRVRWLLALLALALGAVVVWTGRAGRRRRSRAGAPAGGRLWTARALAAGGTEVLEIAQRTGMAQEAIDLALRMAGVTPDGGTRRLRSPATSAGALRTGRLHPRPAADGEAQRLARELVHGVRDLRDGRLTYGTGARR